MLSFGLWEDGYFKKKRRICTYSNVKTLTLNFGSTQATGVLYEQAGYFLFSNCVVLEKKPVYTAHQTYAHFPWCMYIPL